MPAEMQAAVAPPPRPRPVRRAMSVASWQTLNRIIAGWVQQLGAILAPGLQIRVLRLHDVVVDSGATSGTHAHAMFELSVVQRGVVAYAYDGTERPVAAGGTFAMPPGRRHGWRVAAGPAVITGYQLQITAADAHGRGQLERWYERLVASGGWTLPPQPLPAALVDTLHGEALGNADLGCQLIRSHLLWSFERLGAWLDEGQPEAGMSDGEDALIRLRDYVLEHLTEELSLAAVAKRFGVSPRHLNRRFATLTGKPIHRFIVDQRLERASQSLVSRDEPVASIARSVGYDDPGYFGRLFRARFGLSPDRWRIETRSRRKG